MPIELLKPRDRSPSVDSDIIRAEFGVIQRGSLAKNLQNRASFGRKKSIDNLAPKPMKVPVMLRTSRSMSGRNILEDNSNRKSTRSLKSRNSRHSSVSSRRQRQSVDSRITNRASMRRSPSNRNSSVRQLRVKVAKRSIHSIPSSHEANSTTNPIIDAQNNEENHTPINNRFSSHDTQSSMKRNRSKLSSQVDTESEGLLVVADYDDYVEVKVDEFPTF